MFQIEEGIPFPRKPRGRKPVEFPLKDMKVNDSFLIECDPEKVASWKAKISGARRRYKLEAIFRSLPVVGGLRVWRVE